MAIQISYFDVMRVNMSIFAKKQLVILALKIKPGVFLGIRNTNLTFEKRCRELLWCDKSILVIS